MMTGFCSGIEASIWVLARTIIARPANSSRPKATKVKVIGSSKSCQATRAVMNGTSNVAAELGANPSRLTDR